MKPLVFTVAVCGGIWLAKEKLVAQKNQLPYYLRFKRPVHNPQTLTEHWNSLPEVCTTRLILLLCFVLLYFQYLVFQNFKAQWLVG